MMKISRTVRSILVFLVVAATLVLSWVGFAKLYPEGGNPGLIPERTFRVVKAVLGDPIGNAVEDKNLPWELILAKIFAIFILIGGVYKVVKSIFFAQWTLLRILFKRDHTVIVGIDEKSKIILSDLKNNYKKNGVIIEENPENEGVSEIQNSGHLVIFGDATDKDALAESGIRRAKNFICFLNDEQKNLQIANTVNELYSEKNTANRLDCFVHLDNPRLIASLQNSQLMSGSKNGLQIRLFNQYEMVSRKFFNRFPAEFQSEIMAQKKFRLLFFGINSSTKSLMLQALRVLHFARKDALEIIVCCENSEKESQIFFEKYPKINKIAPVIFEEFDGTFLDILKNFCEIQPQEIEPVIITTMDDDRGNLDLALEILNASPAENFKIFTLNGHSSAMTKLLGKPNQRLKFFGNLAEICKVELITGETQDHLAKAIHNDYLELQKEFASSESAAYKTTWDELSEDAKNANRAQADHIIYKITATGKDLNNLPRTTFTPEETEELAMTEHERWSAHRYLNGWDFGEKRDDLRKLHPSLIPWDSLPDPEKQKDRDTVLRLPKILHNIHSLEI